MKQTGELQVLCKRSVKIFGFDNDVVTQVLCTVATELDSRGVSDSPLGHFVEKNNLENSNVRISGDLGTRQ